MVPPTPWNLDFVFIITDDYPVPTMRYAQVGFQRRGLFTGYVHDYNGGGSWIQSWFLNGHQFISYYYGLGDTYITLVARRNVEKVYPGLCAEIDEVLRDFIYWRYGSPYCRPKVRNSREAQSGIITRYGKLKPVTLGNTIFESNPKIREPYVVEYRGKVVLADSSC